MFRNIKCTVVGVGELAFVQGRHLQVLAGFKVLGIENLFVVFEVSHDDERLHSKFWISGRLDRIRKGEEAGRRNI